MIQRTLVLGLLALASSGNAATLKRVTYPSPSPDGKTLVFSWQGDLWTSSISGGDARRITVHPANDTFSKWMPNGSRIVFASDRMGSVDLFSIKPDGTDLKRITFDSFTETPYAVSADGAWIYGYTNAWGSSNCFKVSSSGGDIVRLTGHPLEAQYCPSVSADGKMVAYNNGGRISNWRQAEYKGSNSGEIWIANNSVPFSAAKNLTENEFADMFPMMAPDNSIYFVSNRSGWPNLWRMNSDGSGAKKLTNFSFGTVRYPTMNAGGTVISFEFDSEIYTYNMKSGAVTKLEFDVPADSRISPTLDLTLTTGAGDLAVSPDGKRSAIEVRGDIYLIPEKGGTTRRLTSSVARDSDPVWIGPKTLLFVTGRNHKRELWTVDIQGNEKPFYQHPTLDAVNPKLSPDGKTVAFNLGDQEIGSVPVAGGAMKTLVKSPVLGVFQSGANFDWSPDSKWIAFDVPKERGSTIDALNLETGRRVMVATTARGGTNPKWLPNGKGIFFTADGDQGEDLFMVDLVPADPTFTEDDLDKMDDKPEKKDDKPAVEIDEHFLLERTRRLAVNCSAPVAVGNMLYANVAGQYSTVSVTSGATNPVAGIVGPAGTVVGNGKAYAFFGGKILALGGPVPVPINFSAQTQIDSRAEELALFDEITWALERMYYNPKLNNKDWAGLRKKYLSIIPFTTDRTDFYALMGEFVEELESSHQGATAPAVARPEGAEVTGWLGIEWNWAELASGKYVVGKVSEGTPADLPASRLVVGDQILTVDGKALGSANPLGAMLKNKSGSKVRLGVKRGGKDIEVVIKPTSPLAATRTRYDDWVKWNREQVEKLSGGKLTYHHIQAMDEPSYQKFLREMRTLTNGKKGVILDVRYNGGGSTSHKILGVLIKSPWMYRTLRALGDMKISENIYRGDTLELPSALMTNQYSFSNAEIMSEGFHQLKIGPVIGERTAGGVIGTGAHGLWDGGQIRMPAIGCYAVNGENLERNGRKPDFNVPFDPNMWNAGRDPQLEKAVEELLRKVK